METFVSILGAITGCISLAGIVYFIGVWRGKVDSQLNSLGKSFQDYPPAEMWTMTKTLWDIYVMEALRLRPDLASPGSAYKLNKEGCDLVPDYMKSLLDRIPHNPVLREEIATGYLVVKHLGLDLITQMANEKKLSVQESIAILSTYLVMNANNSRPIA